MFSLSALSHHYEAQAIMSIFALMALLIANLQVYRSVHEKIKSMCHFTNTNIHYKDCEENDLDHLIFEMHNRFLISDITLFNGVPNEITSNSGCPPGSR